MCPVSLKKAQSFGDKDSFSEGKRRGLPLDKNLTSSLSTTTEQSQNQVESKWFNGFRWNISNKLKMARRLFSSKQQLERSKSAAY